jgi:ferredoxin
MKCAVIYFSQTGNTEKIAKAIHTGVKQVAGHCDILTLKEANPKKLYEYDLIGLGSFVIEIEPPNVTLFIRNLQFLGGKHIFSFCTHCELGFSYFPSVIPKLKKKGLTVIGWRDWYGSSWAMPHPHPYLTDGHPDEIDLKEAEEFGRDMVWRSQRIYAGETNLIPKEPVPVTFPDNEENTLIPLEKATMPRFDKDKCTYPKCRLCMDNCPMDGIDLTVDPPIVAKPCMHYPCRFCMLICPTGALDPDQKDLEQLAQHLSKVLKKVGPKVLKESEAQGSFRRLLPEDKVGWDTPVFKAHPKTPRFIIGKGWNYST